MNCTSCRATLPQEATSCPQCGTPVSTSTTYPASSKSFYDLGEESIPYVDYGASGETTPAPASPPEVNVQPSTSPLTEDSPKIPGGAPDLQPQRVHPTNVETQPHRGVSAGMGVLLIVLALLAIISGGGLTYDVFALRPAELNARATAAVQTFVTAQARQANAHATATAAAMTPQDIYNQATNGSPVLNDSLDSAGTGSNDWPEHSGQFGGCTYASGAYHVKITQKSFFVPCMATLNPASNFAFQVQMTIHGDGGGLILRAGNAASNDIQGYFFALSSLGAYAFSVRQGASQSQILQQGVSPAINPGQGQANLLTVIARANTFYLYINRQFVINISDNNFKSGGIGLYALNISQITDVTFNDAQVWNLS